MADLQHITQNRLTEESNKPKYIKQTFVTAIGLPIVLYLAFVNILLGGIVFFIVGGIFLSIKGDAVLVAGAKGEDYALDILKKLPDSYTLYNQVDIPNTKSRTGFNEADVIVVGPDTIFVIEVKHNNGYIMGSSDDKHWDVTKMGRGGTPYYKTIRNPVSQVKKLVWLLSEELKKRKSRAWIQGIVLFSNRAVDLTIANNNATVPVLTPPDIIAYITSYKPKSTVSDIGMIRHNIAKLKAA